ncbi:Putative beta-agarase precursor [Croceitalea dokdonensis DOKDO 023]|uniref:Putative beta-agarase n=1 Tax=Croceitalea dokdonensis DOKDO 023 TaxID=1300341 RepID=A0A0P7B2H2_9FLAO|nr:hypothetical protein [Croceitalea dokdonensis]KPM32442.1 Putative beta-agarase precursor [Croceitalea dokdonensis DOKDO 023]
MNNFKTLLVLCAFVAFMTSCEDDDGIEAVVTLDAGTLNGGPFTFAVDGVPDMVNGITLNAANLTGSIQNYVITDDEKNILGLPPTLEAVEGVDFDAAGVGACYIYHITYEPGLTGLETGANLDALSGDFDLSNFVIVNRNALNAGVLSGGPFSFLVDGMPDMVSGITLDNTELNGETQNYVITDDQRNILGLPPTLEAVEGVNFDAAGIGSCYIYHLTFSGTLSGLEAGENLDDLAGNFSLSNFIEVARNGLTPGILSGGPYDFTVDGMPDMATDLALDNSGITGTNQGFVITDADLNILGLPPTLEAAQGVDFDGAGVGVCLIWHITYEDGIVGLEAGGNAANLDGFFALSNSITVNRNGLNPGILSGGPYEFVVDGTPDMANGLDLDASGITGSNQGFVITDDQLNILGLPPTLEAARGVDFDGAGAGVCLIWHITYEDGIVGLEAGANAANLDGFFALSNSITVTRNPLNAGTLNGGPFTFSVDGTPDMVSGITLDDSGLNGSLQTYVITDAAGNILGLPPTLMAVEGVDFDGAGTGVCYIWHLTYEDGLTGLAMGENTSNLNGFFDLSNFITVTRN